MKSRVMLMAKAALVALLLAMAVTLTQAEDEDPCVALVADGDKQVGLLAFQDDACAIGGLGCFMSMCRFCKFQITQFSQDYVDCPSSNNAFESAVTADCASLVSSGDQTVGISAFYDDLCQSGGLGCFGSQRCRYCRKTETTQSKIFMACPSTDSTTTKATATATSATTPPPIPTTIPTSCDQAVANSKLAGISFVTDLRCKSSTLSIVGCVAGTNCLLCRNTKSEANQYLTSCKILQEQLSLVTSSALVAQADPPGKFTDNATRPVRSMAIVVESVIGGCLVAVGAMLVGIVWKHMQVIQVPGESVSRSSMEERSEQDAVELHDNRVEDELRLKEGSFVQVYRTEEHGSFGV